MYSSCSCWPWWMTLPYVHFFSSSLTQSPTVQLLFKLVLASERSVPELTLLGTLSLHLALIRMRVTPAWPYLAAVCRAVSPYWNRGNRFSLLLTCQTCHSRRKSILETWQKKTCSSFFSFSHPFHFCPLADKLNLSFLFFLFLWGPSAEQGFHLKYSLLPFSNIGASPSSLLSTFLSKKKKEKKRESCSFAMCQLWGQTDRKQCVHRMKAARGAARDSRCSAGQGWYRRTARPGNFRCVRSVPRGAAPWSQTETHVDPSS